MTLKPATVLLAVKFCSCNACLPYWVISKFEGYRSADRTSIDIFFIPILSVDDDLIFRHKNIKPEYAFNVGD